MENLIWEKICESILLSGNIPSSTFITTGQTIVYIVLILKLVIMGIVTAWIAKEKKENKYIWFFLGCFFDSIALFVLMISKHEGEFDSVKLPEANKGVWICDNCETENTGETCKNCGAPKSKIII